VLTPLESFYSRNHGPIPQLDSQTWRLRVDGQVEHVLELSLAELRERFTEQTLVATLQCAGNRRAGLIEVRDIPGEDAWGPCATSTAEWTGVRLADVLAAAGLRPEAVHVAFAAPDISQLADPPQPYGGSITAKKAQGGEVLLAWAINGQPLPAVHGAPVRAASRQRQSPAQLAFDGALSLPFLATLVLLKTPGHRHMPAQRGHRWHAHPRPGHRCHARRRNRWPVDPLLPGATLGAYALIGATAVLASTQRAPLTAIVLVLEFTHTGLVLLVPMMIAVAAANLTNQHLHWPAFSGKPHSG